MISPPSKGLSALEALLMDAVWLHAPCNAERIRETVSTKRILKDSTIRTVLRRLEQKGFVSHTVQDRTFIYRPTINQEKAATRALRQVIDRFCSGSIEELLVGMVNDRMLSKKQLEALARRIAAAEDEGGLDAS
jgi:BlaI family penicillinase repressor